MHSWEMTQTERETEIQRLKDENREAMATPCASEGAVSPYQIGRMGKRARERWEKNCLIRGHIESLIRQLRDPECYRKSHEKWVKAKVEGLVKSRLSRIKDLERLGIGKSGKIKPTYQRAVDKARLDIAEAVAPYPGLVTKYA